MTSTQFDLSQVLGNLGRVTGEMLEAALDGLRDGGEHVLQVSQTRVPLDTAELERSGAVTEDRSKKTVAISYDTPYAVEQHENLTINHANGRSAKYLESAHVGEKAQVEQILATKIRQVLS